MKLKFLLVFSAMFFLGTTHTQAQFWKKLKKTAENAIEREVNKQVDKKVEETVDGIFEGDQKKDKSGEVAKKKSEEKKKENSSTQTTQQNETISKNVTKPKNKLEVYRKFKYIPGEKVIFYDDLQFEEVGEFPSRWDLIEGGVEIALFNGEKVIMGTTDYENQITPLFKNTTNYLGDEFTIEFDIYLDNLSTGWDWLNFDLSFKTNNGKQSFANERNDIHFQFINKEVEGFIRDNGSFDFEKVPITNLQGWNHISLSYYKRKLKVYFNEHRIANLPNFKQEIVDFGINIHKPHSNTENPNQNMKTAIKNIRIAHGGGQMYKRIMADGKYVTNGILFDSGKATIKPQSMGVINKMVNVLNEKSDWKFLIVGHTDSDGDDAANLTLSKQRAAAVKQAIVNAGISADRITTDGKGESEPLNTNSTKEEKANNRRVEFIKQ